MARSAANRSNEPREAIRVNTDSAAQPAAELMWAYYSQHKARLVSSVRAGRDTILAKLIAGVGVEDAFLPYALPAGAKPAGKAASAPTRTNGKSRSGMANVNNVQEKS